MIKEHVALLIAKLAKGKWNISIGVLTCILTIRSTDNVIFTHPDKHGELEQSRHWIHSAKRMKQEHVVRHGLFKM